MEAAVERAFRRAGHETLLIDDRRMKRRIGWKLTQKWARWRASQFSADFVFLSKCLALNTETVEKIIRGKPNAMWYHDPQWYRDLDRRDIGHIASVGKIADTFFVTGFDAEWRANGLNALFLPAAGDSGIRPVAASERYAGQVSFIGAGYDPARARFLVDVATKLNVRVWGPGWDRWKGQLNWTGRTVEGREFAAVCSSSGITLGINPTRAAGGAAYTSDRTWMVMLAGGFYLTERTPGVAAMLEDGVHCAFYDDVQSCIERCSYYLANEGERNTIREQGEKFVRAHHTYDQRIANILDHRPFVISQ
jgi:hypothetical protein